MFDIEHVMALKVRRKALSDALDGRTAAIFCGHQMPRNYSANPYPFRASSHFLFFVGRALPGSCLYFGPMGQILFVPRQPDSDVVWHGLKPSLAQLERELEIEVRSMDALAEVLEPSVLTLPVMDEFSRAQQRTLLGRTPCISRGEEDYALAKLVVDLRSVHDSHALKSLTKTIRVARDVHLKVPQMLATKKSPLEIFAQMQFEFAVQGYGFAYNPIITSRGEVLHGGVDTDPSVEGGMLLLDVGCEHPEGWASDITRTWSISGAMSTTQEIVYSAVKNAQAAAISYCVAGAEFKEVHLAAFSSLTKSLKDIGILRGNLDDLLNLDVAATFFPHGVGHLLGLDVHDMEDLGDVAGYAPGRERSERPSLRYLRLNRPLAENMLVTIEPGFYQIPSLLEEARQRHFEFIDWGVLSRFSDVRGIRLEDDVLIGVSSPSVLSSSDEMMTLD